MKPTFDTMNTPASGSVPPPLLRIDSTRRLRTGNEMPLLGLGTWLLTSHTADAVAEAMRIGYRMFDTSPDYQTQAGIGTALQSADVPRESLYIVSKVEAEEDTYEATRRNLRELHLEYADLMLIHEPPARGAGADAWKGLMRARDEGFVRDIGVCSYSVDELRELAAQTGEMPAVQQIE
jgi:2,5-diketo-D-gluconate reductase A